MSSDAEIERDFRVIKNAAEAGYFDGALMHVLEERVLKLLGVEYLPLHVEVLANRIKINFSPASYVLLITYGS